MKISALFCFLLVSIFDSCRIFEMIAFGVSDYHSRPKFGERLVSNPEDHAFKFHEAYSCTTEDVCELKYCSPIKNRKKLEIYLDDYLANHTKTTAFLMIHKDSIVYENYFEGYDQYDIFPSWSIAKSFTGTLVGIAIDEGFINNEEDLVIKYLPEFEKYHPYWKELTLKNLLNMRSGFDYNEMTYKKPKKGITNLYLSRNSIENVKKTGFKHKPGTVGRYSSLDSQVLGLVMERVLGIPLSKYLEEKIWIPLGMESEATWNYESQKFNHTKAYCCLKATARDYAKLGRLYLKKGNWNGKQIISEEWIEKATTPKTNNKCYQYNWYMDRHLKTVSRDGEKVIKIYDDSISAQKLIDPKREYVSHLKSQKGYVINQCGPCYMAAGVFEQRVFVDPENEIIFVRLGKKKNLMPEHLFHTITDHFLENQ